MSTPARRLRLMWQQDTAAVLVGCAVMAVALAVYTATLGAEINAGRPDGQSRSWLFLDLFLFYRCYRGGSIAWALLVMLHGLPLVLMTLGMVGWPGWYAAGLLALIAVPLGLLMSPAVRGRILGDGRSVPAAAA